MKISSGYRLVNFRGLAFRYGVFFITGMLVIFIIAFIYTFEFTRSILRDKAHKEAQSITDLTVSKILNIIQPIQQVPQTLAQIMEYPDPDYTRIMSNMKGFVKDNPEVYGSCLAFEPNRFEKNLHYYAPYYFETGEGIEFKNLGNAQYDYFTKEWYLNPKIQEKSLWSEPYYDEGGGEILMCTYSVPFYQRINGKRTFSGIITMDLSLASLQNIVSQVNMYKSGRAFMISEKGKIISYFDAGHESKDIRDVIKNKNEKILSLLDKMMEGENGFVSLPSLESPNPSYLYYAPVGSTKWSFGLVFPTRELFGSLYEFFYKLIFIFILSIVAVFLISIFITQKFTHPIKRLVEATRLIGQGDFNAILPVHRSKDEISELTGSFSHMQNELKSYILNLKETTMAKERMESELNVAHQIQLDMLPKVFPRRNDCDVFALLEPARYVGGDMYDFFFLDEDHLFVGIGDVSGKGVPAALFMSVTRTLFRARTQLDVPLHEVMASINRELCRDNPNVMFVTFFSGIIDLRNGVMEVCNAGHLCPIQYLASGETRKYECMPDPPLGVTENATYHSGRILIEVGDKFILYTDGITEACDPDFNLFEKENLVKTVQEEGHLSPPEIAAKLLDNVRIFAGSAEQSDDITLLLLEYKGQKIPDDGKSCSVHLAIKNNVSELEKIVSMLEQLGKAWTIPSKVISDIHLAIEELITNIIFYAFDDPKEHLITLEIIRKKKRLVITVEDDGKPFNLLEKADDVEISESIENRKIGGLGIHFIKSLTDALEYERAGDKNRVIISKHY